MRREYIDSMKSDDFSEFISACEGLKNCKYIIAEAKITELLKTIADNKQVYSMFGVALFGFDYSAAFSEAIKNGGFTLPADRKTAIALVFRLLLDIDNREKPLNNFLEAYFYSETLNEAYARFALEVIVPFESYCKSIYAQTDHDVVETAIKEATEESHEKLRSEMHNGLKEDALKCVEKLVDFADSNMENIIDRAECIACLRNLSHCLNTRDYDEIISTFIGVKYTVLHFFKTDNTVIAIYEQLENDIKKLVG